jgi:imidazolonepropionase-like amidohydrolase
LSLGFSNASLSISSYPTSYASALAELNQRFEKPTGAFARARAGELPCLFEASTRADVQRVTDFARRWKLRGSIYGAAWAGEQLDLIRDSGLSVIFAPLGIGADRRSIQSVVKLASSDIAFGFGLDSPVVDPAALRLTAALCVREGLDTKRAWRALTTQAAELAGVGKTAGSLQKGRDADFVLWSGHPLELSSSISAVYIDGKLVHEAKKP